MVQPIALPERLKKYAGRIIDVDSHEMMPAQAWLEGFGPDIQPLYDAWTFRGEGVESHANHPNVPDYPGDIAPIDENIVNVKGVRSPGARNPGRRLEVMDAMGVDKQLMFPGQAGLNGLQLVISKDERDFLIGIKGDREQIGKRFMHLYNDWAVEFGRMSNRIRPVVPVYGDTVEEMCSRAKSLIDRGIKAIWLAAPVPPADLSPAHPDLDRFWAMLAEADCAATLHLGSEGGNRMFASTRWGEAPAFEGHRALSEFRMDPWSLSTIHLPTQNFLATMISGGVFVRHPKLRFGVIEVGAYWVGPMAEFLDLWHKNLGVFNTNVHKLPELPSTYLRNNVRVSTFPFEDAATYMERYHMEDVICFASDYPHIEGGKDNFNVTSKNIERLGPEIMEKFYVTNGQLLVPN